MWTWTIRPAPRHAGSVGIPLLPALKPSFNEADYRDKSIWRPQLRDLDTLYLRRQYRDRLASLRAVDDLIRSAVDALGSELERTTLIFTSDNGFLYGEHRLPEKLTAYEAVHEIRSWQDLKNRLGEDRRCFAYFHPHMPEEPLIFVEVALVNGIASNVQELLDPNAPILEAERI